MEPRQDKALIKMASKMKSKLRVHKARTTVTELVDAFDKKGITLDKEAIRSRSKNRRSLASLDAAADKLAEKALNDSDDEGEDIVMDDELAKKEQKERGRKRRRDRSVDSDELMDVDEN